MTVSSTTTRVTYTGNGVTTAFATTFPFFAPSEIEVIERVIATGAETVKALTTHYTVSGGNGAGGTVTAVGGAPASTVQWVLRRKTARTQEIDYTANDPFPAETHEQGLDRLKMNVQELGEEQDRSLKFPKSDDASLSAILPSSVDRAGKFLTFDASGTPAVAAGSADGIAVSPFAATLLDDADAAAARSTLGIGESDLDITGLTALTAPAVGDELPIYDLSALANRKITLADLLKVIAALTAETAPATDDALALYDTSAGATDKITLADLLKVVNGLTEDTSPDAANDFLLAYDASAGAAKKVKPANLGIAVLADAQTFTGSGTWTKPAGASWVWVEAWGGGGGGGRNAGDQAGSGGGGGYAARLFRAADLGATVAVTVGAGGGGATSGSSNGGGGGTTTFGSHLTAPGGTGGNTNGNGGRGGLGISPGGWGDAFGGIIDSYAGGGGGGGGTSVIGGNGGAVANPGTAGSAPGGGGGGGNGANSSGGSGGRGECRVYSW